jgi:hypothetical protein
MLATGKAFPDYAFPFAFMSLRLLVSLYIREKKKREIEVTPSLGQGAAGMGGDHISKNPLRLFAYLETSRENSGLSTKRNAKHPSPYRSFLLAARTRVASLSFHRIAPTPLGFGRMPRPCPDAISAPTARTTRRSP